MTDIKHTPGPWEAEPMTGRGAWVKGANGNWAALSCGETDPEALANARLIAAAPDLLEHLKSRCADLRAALDCKSWEWDGDQRDCAEIEYASSMALIAKAESRSTE